MLTETREADIESLLQQGQAAAQQGDMTGAREALSRIVELEPNNEKAWLWLSGVVEDPAEQQICLENVLVINPSNESARQGLEFLQSQGVTTAVVENAEASMAAPIQAPSADPTAVPSYVDEPQGPAHDLTSPLSSVAVEEVEMFAPEAEVDVVPSWVPAPAPSNGFANAGNGFSEPTESSQMP
ncbi:MAG TPA: hypothetical protein VM409_00180, partial [Chloroflexia bacterium]|nr:hypothetical protein [Chloroflexia bacterium]